MSRGVSANTLRADCLEVQFGDVSILKETSKIKGIPCVSTIDFV
jgi:hypothetical protein